jgi:predicted XRE-type DNA-binding protein
MHPPCGHKNGVIDEQLVQDPATTALDHLASAADEGASELRELQHDLTVMKEERGRGSSWRQIMATSPVPRPLAHIARITANLAAAGGAFRQAVAKALRSEGMQVTAIADLFDVSRQRVSTLVRSDGATTDGDPYIKG